MVRFTALRLERPEPPLRLANDLMWVARGSNAIVSSEQRPWGDYVFQLRVQGGHGWTYQAHRRVLVG
jgi:hypothetical protein